jgi:O-antigen biosynthesis protein
MLVLPPAALPAVADIEQVFVLTEDSLYSPALVRHQLLDPCQSIGHIRHMLPTLQCAPPMTAILQEALRPRFDGRDTLSGNAHPVRAALDFVAVAEDVGLYLAGWVFDPSRVLAALHVRGTAGFSARVDDAWTRVVRDDVAAAFRTEPGFPTPLDNNGGFAVQVGEKNGGPRLDEALYLQFTFHDGDSAFLPIPSHDAADPAVRARMLHSVDLHKHTGLPIVERHIAPFIAMVRPAADPPGRIIVRGQTDRPETIVVPLVAACPPRALLSSFLHDRLDHTEQLMLVCGPDWTDPDLERLRDLLRFYGLPASIIATGIRPGPAAALRAAAELTTSSHLLVASPGVIGCEPGWRQALRAALCEQEGAMFACPTLLYEDWSIRFAGSGVLRFMDGPPYAEMTGALDGMPSTLAAANSVQATALGILACCLVRRAALAALDGGPAMVTDAGREALFFQRLQAGGMSGAWVPSVRVYAPEDDADVTPQGRVGRLVDGWVLRHAWRRTAAEEG